MLKRSHARTSPATTIALAEKPKLSPTNAKALSRMKLAIKKNNSAFAEQIQAYRENPETPVVTSESEQSDMESDAESLDSEAEAERQFERTVRTGVVERPKDKVMSMAPEEITYDVVQKKLGEVAAARGRVTALDRQDQVEMLSFLFGAAHGAAQKIEVLVHKITVIFDMNNPMTSPMTTANWKICMASVFDMMALVADNPCVSLADNPVENDRTTEPAADEPITVWGNPAAFLERLDDEWTGSLKSTDPHTNAYMERLRDEAALLALAGLVADFLDELVGDTAAEPAGDGEAAGEVSLIREKTAAVALRRMDHIYYKTQGVYSATRNMAMVAKSAGADAKDAREAKDATETAGAAGAAADDEAGEEAEVEMTLVLPASFELPEKSDGMMEQLAATVYSNGNDNQKGNAVLYSVYFKSIHDDFYGARDMLLMSRMSEQTQQLDINMQILFNRTTAQLGLCAFRNGLVNESYSCLIELYGSLKVKELLAQGMQLNRYQEKTPEQEMAEKRRQVPFHLHINLELLEASFLACAILLEAANMALYGAIGWNQRQSSKPLRRLLDMYDRQTFLGPPENVRDHMTAACRALATGDWKKSYGYVSALPCWNLLGQSKDVVLGLLKTKFQEEGLRAYLLAHAKFYTSLSMEQLCNMFELSERRAHAIVSGMIANESLAGSFDQPTNTVVMLHEEATRLQKLASQFADKASVLVDFNERALAMRTGVLITDDDEDSSRKGPDSGGRRTRMGGRIPGGRGRGRGRRFDRAGGFVADAGFSGGVFGKGRNNSRGAQQRDNSSFVQLGRVNGGRGGGRGGRRNMGNDRV
jgi:translation initiation factor 3 subunit C